MPRQQSDNGFLTSADYTAEGLKAGALQRGEKSVQRPDHTQNNCNADSNFARAENHPASVGSDADTRLTVGEAKKSQPATFKLADLGVSQNAAAGVFRKASSP